MSDLFTEVEHEGFFAGIGSSLGKALLGLVLFLGSFVVHWWNEGRAVDRYKTLEQGAKDVIATESYSTANAGKLVYVSGDMQLKTPAMDKDFKVQASDAMKLVRQVEMYQWHEKKETKTRKNLGGEKVKETTYRYTKKWANHQIDSNSFKLREGHANPRMDHKTVNFAAQGMSVAGYELTSSEINKLDNYKDLSLPQGVQVPKKIGAKSSSMGNALHVSSQGQSTPDSPAVGDYKISFKYIPQGKVSIIAQQSGKGFSPLMAETGELYEVRSGNLSADAIFKKAVDENKNLTWILRGVGLIFMAIGLAMIASPIEAVLDFIPFLGDMFGYVSGFFALIVALLLSSITIAVTWFAHRPMLSFAVGGAGVIIWLLVRMMQPKRQHA